MILRVVSAAGALTALYGIAQYFGWDPILPAAAYHIGEGIWTIVRPPSTLGYVSYFATWLLFVVFLSLAVPGRLAKACAALALIAMLLTGTRAAFLGFAVGAVVWGGMKLRTSHAPTRRTLWRAAGFAGAALLAGLVLYVSPMGQPLRGRARWFAEDPWGGARPLLWRDSLRMGLARPLAGYGPETFRATFPITSPPRSPAPIPISPTNRRTIFSSTRWWRRVSPDRCCWEHGARSGLRQRFRFAGGIPTWRHAWPPRSPREWSASSLRCSRFPRR